MPEIDFAFLADAAETIPGQKSHVLGGGVARIGGRRFPLRHPHLALALRDLSLGGLSAISQLPVEQGERLTVFFPPQGTQRGWDAYGRVLRCEPSGFGYRIAVEFDPLPAA